MVGIAEMFSELSGDEPDWFQMVFMFERQREIKLERQRESQRLCDMRKRYRLGLPPRGKRGRPRLSLTPEQMRERKKEQNRKAQRKFQAARKERYATQCSLVV